MEFMTMTIFQSRETLVKILTTMFRTWKLKSWGYAIPKWKWIKLNVGKSTDMTARGTVDIKVSASFTILVKYV